MFLESKEQAGMDRSMVRKKLLTLAGVVGILACGACFLGPQPERTPPPAPPTIHGAFDGIQNIRVEVENTSPSHHLDSAALAQKIADTINEQSWTLKINAHVGKDGEKQDAVLAVTILSETVEPATLSKSGSVTFHIKDSATLMKLQSVLQWRETEVENPFIRFHVKDASADLWSLPVLLDQVDKELSIKLVNRLVSADRAGNLTASHTDR
ncbi:MAG: hypothetical protein WAN35_13275 [Terracidiphilus sp.]